MTRHNGTRPFWMHQLVEYILGITLVSQALQSATPAVPAIAGGAVLVNAAIVRGPMAAFRLVGRRTHRLLDLVVIGLTLVLALQPVAAIDAGARSIMVFIALVHGFVWWQSDLSEPVVRPPRGQAAASPPATPGATKASSSTSAPGGAPSGTSAGTSTAADGDRSAEVGRVAGRAVGAGVRAVRRWTRP